MITQYYRPKTIQEALELIAMPDAIPLAGGTHVNNPEFRKKILVQSSSAGIIAVDLQELGLNNIRKHGNTLEIDACVTLQQLLDNQHTPAYLKNAIKQEASLNIRNAATVAGTLVACDGRSSFATAILALDAKLIIAPDNHEFMVGNFLPQRKSLLGKKLITQLIIPLNLRFSFEYAARTPGDLPIVCASVAQWDSGRTRLALGGYGSIPLLALDGTNVDDIQASARNAFHEAADEWASAEYRSDVAAILAKRCLEHSST